MAVKSGLKVCAWAAVLASALGVSQAGATTSYVPVLENQLFVQATAAGVQDTHEIDTGLVTGVSSISNQFTATANSPSGASASSTASVTTSFGAFDVSGSGVANPVSGNGAESRVIPYFGGEPLGYFRDYIFMDSATLAPGAAATLAFDFAFTGTASYQSETVGAYASSADISARFTVQDLQHDWDPNHTIDVSYSSPISQTLQLNTFVGDVLEIEGALYADGEAASFDAGGPSSFTFSDPTTVSVSPVGGDLVLTSASGHDYAPAAVPEPATWAMMLAGLFGLGAVLRSARRSAQARPGLPASVAG